MMLAKGSSSWILTPLITGIIFFVLFIISKDVLASVMIFITIIMFLLTGFFLVFFRDPNRDTGSGIVAAADGKIRDIYNVNDEKTGEYTLISTFMNVYNVHVNRMPINGVIKEITHLSGSYLPAFKKESEKNERLIYEIDTEIGTVKLVQIAGTLARRIINYVHKGDNIKKGEKIGMIKLGSRVDIYLPLKKIKHVNVKIGDIVKAGRDTIAEIND